MANGFSVKRVVILTVVILILIFGALIGYLYIIVHNSNRQQSSSIASHAHIAASIGYEQALSYNYANYLEPYISVNYASANATEILINASVYKSRPPQHIYVLNYTNACYQCGNATAVYDAFKSSIADYNLNSIYGNISQISIPNLNRMPNDSILVILNGLLPINFTAGNAQLMNQLISKHTSIIYIGQNFSTEFVVGTTSTQEIVSKLPLYLDTINPNNLGNSYGFYFNRSTFKLLNGIDYGYLSYENVGNGSIVVFPNTLQSWKSPLYAGKDIARAIAELFWLPSYAQGASYATISLNNTGKHYGSLGVIEDKIPISYTQNATSTIDAGYMRVVVIGVSPYVANDTAYDYIYQRPDFSSNGTVSMSSAFIPGYNYMRFVFNITNKPINPIKLATFLYVYDQNMSLVSESSNVTTFSNFSISSAPFVIDRNLTLGPGNYIVLLKSFNNSAVLAGGLFTISPILIRATAANFTVDRYVFTVLSQNTLLNGINYTITVNGAYPQKGKLDNGELYYQLPSGSPSLTGLLLFNVSMLSENFNYGFTYTPLPFEVNPEYAEAGIAGLIVAIMILFVKAPVRDEFYIDVPSMRIGKKINIKLKASEVEEVFGKLNSNYHWRFMPLSKDEVKAAISLNIKYSNIPVELTYANIERILDTMVVGGYVTYADNLYMPKSWIDASGHDMIYLATFKKLRMYFVTHNYTFTDLDQSDAADIVAKVHGDTRYIIIYSKTSKFMNVPIYNGSKTYLVFLNSFELEAFKSKLFLTPTNQAQELKMYISADYVALIDADNFDSVPS